MLVFYAGERRAATPPDVFLFHIEAVPTSAARLGRATFRPRTVRATVGLACSFVVRFAIVRFSERAFAFGSLSCALANVRSRSVRYGPNSQAKTNLIQHRVTTDSEYPSLH